MFNEVIAFLNGNTNKQNICLSYGLLAIVATLDFITSFQISLSLFYLAPIMIVTWYGKTWHGYFICFLSVFIWSSFGFQNDVFSGNHIILAWNSLIKLGIFLTISSLLLTLKNNLFLQEDLASHDELTQLLNRRSFQEQATQLINISRRHKQAFSLAFIDIDRFKKLNDEYGHAEGDIALQLVARTMLENSRSTDVVGRLGGDEFVLFLPYTDNAGTKLVIEKLYSTLMQQVELKKWPINFSIGVAHYLNPPNTFDEALNNADEMMYKAKASKNIRIIYHQY